MSNSSLTLTIRQVLGGCRSLSNLGFYFRLLFLNLNEQYRFQWKVALAFVIDCNINWVLTRKIQKWITLCVIKVVTLDVRGLLEVHGRLAQMLRPRTFAGATSMVEGLFYHGECPVSTNKVKNSPSAILLYRKVSFAQFTLQASPSHQHLWTLNVQMWTWTFGRLTTLSIIHIFTFFYSKLMVSFI